MKHSKLRKRLATAAAAICLCAITVTMSLPFGANGRVFAAEQSMAGALPVQPEVPSAEQAPAAETPAETQTPAAEAPAGQVFSVYTNELVSEEQAARRPIAIMMPTDKAAQPSYGISNAKILYEVMEEGEISRQMAIIDNWQDLSKIGNIRSCRDYYIPLATEWDSILIHFGGVYYMQKRITASDINNLSGTSEYGTGGAQPGSSYFFRSADKSAPHNAYISGEAITSASNELGYSLAVRPQYYNESHFTFANGVNTLEQYAEAIPANTVDLSKIFTYTKSSFTYNAETGLYSKQLHGAAQVDGLNNEQLTFSNIIIQNTKWKTRDKKGYLSFQMTSGGDGYYFTQGRGIHITWKKASDYSPTKYYDDAGNEIQLNAGKTYIGIAQDGREVITN